MRLYLIRHGQSQNNALYEQGLERDRHFDPDLTEIGHEQARRVAKYLAENNDMPGRLTEPFNLSHLYCSAITRAMQTLSLSHCEGRKKYGQVIACHPSPFLKEMPSDLIENAAVKAKQPVTVDTGKSLFAGLRAAIGE